MDFAKQINAPLGPTEEIRIKFGPYLYNLTRIANQIHILVSCILAVSVGSFPWISTFCSYGLWCCCVVLFHVGRGGEVFERVVLLLWMERERERWLKDEWLVRVLSVGTGPGERRC